MHAETHNQRLAPGLKPPGKAQPRCAVKTEEEYVQL